MSEPHPSAEAPAIFRIEPLASHHDRAAFSCGALEQDSFLQKYAMQRAERNISRTFVLVATSDPQSIVGFYCLSNYAVATTELPDPLRKGLPKHQLAPAILLGQLAVDRKHQGAGLGKTLLHHALRQSLRASFLSAACGVVVHAGSQDLIPFYNHYGFVALPDNPQHLIAPMMLIARLFPNDTAARLDTALQAN
jgi:predicted N-acetyltransferase YhbS